MGSLIFKKKPAWPYETACAKMRFDLDLSSKAIATRNFSRKSSYFIEIMELAIDK